MHTHIYTCTHKYAQSVAGRREVGGEEGEEGIWIFKLVPGTALPVFTVVPGTALPTATALGVGGRGVGEVGEVGVSGCCSLVWQSAT